MGSKERLVRFKDLLRILAREHDLESSHRDDFRTAVLQESWTLLELLGTIEGFLSDERLGVVGEDAKTFTAAKNVLKAWMAAARQGTLTPQDAARFSQRVTMIIAKTAETLDQLLTALDAEKQDMTQHARMASEQTPLSAYASYGAPQRMPWYKNVMAASVLAIAPLIAGCVPGQRASAQEPINPTIQNQVQNDYAKELDKRLQTIKIEEGKTAEEYHALAMTQFGVSGGRNYLLAIACEKKAIQMDSGSIVAQVTLGNSYWMLAAQESDSVFKQYLARESINQYEKARGIVERSDKKNEHKRRYLATIDEGEGNAYYLLGQIEKAKNLLSSAAQVRELNPQSKKVLDSL